MDGSTLAVIASSLYPWPLILFTYIHLPRPDFCPDGNEGQLPMRFEVATIEASRKDKSDKEGFNEVD